MGIFGHIPLIDVTRGSITESIHYGSAAIVLNGGEKNFSFGDNVHSFFLRSSAKPFQALAFFENGGISEYQLTNQEIAIICSSHSGTDEHVQVLDRLQKKIGISEELLQCGLHPPFHKETALRMIKNDEDLHPNRHDCSGKHTGMLGYAKMINAPLDSYLELTHPVQQLILSTFSEMSEVPTRKINLGVDGCSAPVFAVPLTKAASAYARLCQPDDLKEDRAKACKIICASMAEYPQMVGGPERFDTDLMKAANGRVITKEGAEGYLGIGVLPGASSIVHGSIGITIKISDGDPNRRASSLVGLIVLKELGVISTKELTKLREYYIHPIKNWRDKDIGEIRPSHAFLNALRNIKL
jgi:L-asparaginase II